MREVVTTQTPMHAFGQGPRHALVDHPDLRDLHLCGHVFEQAGMRRICVLDLETHLALDHKAVLDLGGDEDRVRLLGFALQKIVRSSNLDDIHALAELALRNAGELP